MTAKAAEYFSSWTGEPNTAMEFHSVINSGLSLHCALASLSMPASVPLFQRLASSGRKNISVMASLRSVWFFTALIADENICFTFARLMKLPKASPG